MNQPTEGPRARYRQQVRDEVQARAWEQISQAGASALSLKAIATQMGMTAPALYRYYGSRDELLTQLILSTYQDLAELVEAAVDDDQHARAAAHRHRAGATPVGRRQSAAVPAAVRHAGSRLSRPPAATELAQRIFAPDPRRVCRAHGRQLTTSRIGAFHRSVTFWTRLHGVLSLELAGHFVGMDIDTDQLYAAEIHSC